MYSDDDHRLGGGCGASPQSLAVEAASRNHRRSSIVDNETGTPRRYMVTRLAISVSAVSKWYGPVVALDGLDLEVGRGSIVGLVGPNGAERQP